MRNLFLFLMIIFPAALSAQIISVSGLVVKTEAGSPSTVTFDVSWTEPASTATLWMDSAWVFVDYNKNGKMERLLISGGTLTYHTANTTQSPDAGKMIILTGNDRGAWVSGDARTNSPFSATVQLFTDETNIAGACAYASSYPPVGRHVSSSEIVFTGTPMYEITLTDGSTVETIESGGTFLLPCSYTMSSFTDATGAPGIKCIVPTGLSLTANYETICTGQSATLTALAVNADYYSINGSNWQASPVFKVSPTSNASYTLYAKTSDECSASLTNAATVAVNSIPSVPLTPTHNGPKCAGTGITFSASLPGGATGLDWTGSVSGQGTSKTTATTAGNYSAQVRSYLTSGTTCYSEWTSTVSSTITAIPSVPSAAPTQDGPKCAGTGITFSATKPADATGLDWTGSVSGQGTSKTTATTAGNYSAQVRSYLTSAGTTCYSGWTGSVSATINGPGGRDQSSTCGCTSGLNLTACNGYCRNLTADQATCWNNLEIIGGCIGGDVSGCTQPSGYARYVTNMDNTKAILTQMNAGAAAIAWTTDTGSGPCRYGCSRSACTCYPGGNAVSLQWLGYR